MTKDLSSSIQPPDSSPPGGRGEAGGRGFSRAIGRTAIAGIDGEGAAGVCGTAFMTVVFSGETGKAISAKVTGGDFKATGQADCIAEVVSKTSVPPFKKPTFVTTYSFDLTH